MKSPKVLLMPVASILLCSLPFQWTRFIARIIGRFEYLNARTRRHTLITNLSHTLHAQNPTPTELNRAVRRTFENLALSIIGFLQIPRFTRSGISQLTIRHGLEYIDQALKRGRGAILVSAHLGDWELACASFARLGYSIVLVSEQVRGGLTKTLGFYRRWAGVEVVLMNEPIKMVRALKNNKILLLAGDRDLTGTGIELPFFNGLRKIPRGPAAFTLKTRATLLTGLFVLNPVPGKPPYFGRIEPPIEYTPTGTVNDDTNKLTRILSERIQAYIREYPEQWFVFQPDWR